MKGKKQAESEPIQKKAKRAGRKKSQQEGSMAA